MKVSNINSCNIVSAKLHNIDVVDVVQPFLAIEKVTKDVRPCERRLSLRRILALFIDIHIAYIIRIMAAILLRTTGVSL